MISSLNKCFWTAAKRRLVKNFLPQHRTGIVNKSNEGSGQKTFLRPNRSIYFFNRLLSVFLTNFFCCLASFQAKIKTKLPRFCFPCVVVESASLPRCVRSLFVSMFFNAIFSSPYFATQKFFNGCSFWPKSWVSKFKFLMQQFFSAFLSVKNFSMHLMHQLQYDRSSVTTSIRPWWWWCC